MVQRRLMTLLDAPIGVATAGLLRLMKCADRRRSADFAGALFRRFGPLLKEHRLGRDNLRAAYPEKTAAEIEKILAGVWDNLGRVAVEFAHLDEFHLGGREPHDGNELSFAPGTAERYERIVASGKPTLGFAAHLANWEIPAVAAKLADINLAVLYRRPNIRAIGDAVIALRAGVMGELVPTGLDAPVRLGRLLQSGVHAGMLVDQYFGRGVDVTFFGRRCATNPLIALLARQTGIPIYGMRAVRLPGGNSFQIEVTGPIEPPRAADGRIDIAATMQAITAIVEGWIREHPEQWLWLHRRWR